MTQMKRNLLLDTVGGLLPVPVTLFEPTAHDSYWQCRFSIGWPEGQKMGAARGADAIQALYLAMESLAVGLYASDHHKAGRLFWEKPGRGYGFPMPKVGRDQLVGEDKLAQF